MCPDTYTVMFHGPSRHSIPPESFQKIDWNPNPPHHYAKVDARWTVHDPGEYLVYAYPEFVYCRKWEGMEFPYSRASVQGAPFLLTVHPGRSPSEGYGICSSNQPDFGRYLPTNSPQLKALFKKSTRKFAWAPYKCKIPP